MAGGFIASSGGSPAFQGKMTVYVFICVVIAAFAGLIFGYDIGISGTVLFSINIVCSFFFFTLLIDQDLFILFHIRIILY